ncbi:hypothetical protein COX86_04395 [Candidatus Micrarchaeota archaeon CG_4_10_14_0_2_um_filter_60_11]|nr:MAG: hypothetical protein AUJ16_01565 [Candidatus Micrarchaeota archaeon CG1_02_60_51]PIN96617.1 MAG: hypothetical protein COU39_00445 [Candidatus Micrarchaeota archaeon CG10_big_fil_rev_8_21_14_0_10_60_32]PIO01648.1 MAG: hypothetical protein COT58_04060 [Candidatus Micrarchaeota archaeon CG09_land_8_20_14_0_10_60_16]PIY91686.1 MAG: hypothetical protein COY71_01790 [Candidatus Micrarchaeota archaeon CG_4_10_14_0_8_um_filter_60_7]PIZ90549.1 MAG: hypothetical protein COX86_04395 [Candidatus Mi
MFEDVLTILSYTWWIWLFIVGWWYYAWAREHLAFSPLLTLVVGGILVYYLVLEHPLLGSLGMVGWILMTSGILYLVPVVGQLWNTFLPTLPKKKEVDGYGY